jgi:glycosyltransferase involved in cell wall biosynthesis/ubiquinone/menaquinone biosynthesis C-methylase UbiE
MKNIWDKKWSEYKEAKIDFTTKTIWNEILKHVSFKNKSILELGAGTGRLSFLALEEGGDKATLVDSSKQALSLAKALIGQRSGVKFVNRDLLNLELNEEAFDIVMSSGVIEHFRRTELAQAIKTHKKFLGPQGRLVLIVPASLHYNNLRFRFKSTRSVFSYQRPFSRRKIRRLLERENLEVLENKRFFLSYGLAPLRKVSRRWRRKLEKKWLLNILFLFSDWLKPRWLDSLLGGLIIVVARRKDNHYSLLNAKPIVRQNLNICMFVWNYFTHDARVIREAHSLVNAGHQVSVVAILNANDPNSLQQETKEGINIIRVSPLPYDIDKIYRFFEKILKSPESFRVANFLERLSDSIRVLRNKLFVKHRPIAIEAVSESKWTQLLRNVFTDIVNWLLIGNLLKFISFIITIFFGILSFVIKIPVMILLAIPGLFPMGFIGRILTNQRLIKQGLKTNADVYHAHDLNMLLAAYRCSRLNSSKLIYDSHEIATDREGIMVKSYWDFLEWALIKKADKVIFTTHTRAEFTSQKYDISLPEVIHNYSETHSKIEKVDLRAMLGLGQDEKIILYQGGLQSNRGLEKLIEAIPLIQKGIITFIGDGVLRENLEFQVKRARLNERVRFMGMVPVEKLLSYTACADVGLQILQNTCFNHYSTISNKLFEYLMAGVPVVASDFPEIRRIIEEFNAGVLIDPHKPEEIAKGINYLLEDEERRKEMARNAKRASRRYNWQNEEPKLFDIYNSLFK